MKEEIYTRGIRDEVERTERRREKEETAGYTLKMIAFLALLYS